MNYKIPMIDKKIDIRKVVLDDLNCICDLLNKLYDGKIEYESFTRRYKDKLYDMNSYNIVALIDNNIVGVCISDLQVKLRRSKLQCFIEDLIVDENYRNYGIGTYLLQNVVEYAKKHDCEVVKLSSSITNVNAHRFYEKNGFIKHSFEFKLNLN